MKIIEKIFKTQFALMGLLFFPLMSVISSCKDQTLDIDITEFSWMLKEVRTNGNTFKPKKKEYLRDAAFVLKFKTDSKFSLNTSANLAGGEYKISTKGQIIIYFYKVYTEAGESPEDLPLINNLLNVFKTVTGYKIIGKTLIFKGVNGEVEFKKK